MLLEELDVGSKITILVGIGNQTLTFDTVLEQVLENGTVLTTPVYRNDKLVGFRTKGLILHLQANNISDHKIYEFSNVEILNVKTKDEQIHHRIICKNPGKQINRRTAVRVWLGLDGIAQIGKNRTVYDVIIKDISVSGISFIFDKDLEVEQGTMTHITFRDSESHTNFNLNALIVRKEVLEDGKVLYGCRLNQENPAIAKYVNDKQREKLKASRTVGKTIPLAPQK